MTLVSIIFIWNISIPIRFLIFLIEGINLMLLLHITREPYKRQMSIFIIVSIAVAVLLSIIKYECSMKTKRGHELLRKLNRERLELLNSNVKLQEIKKKEEEVMKEYDVDYP